MRSYYHNLIRKLLLRLNRHKVIYILGDGRSGTTWIASMLNFNGRYLDYFEPYHGRRILNISDRRVYPLESELPDGSSDFEKYVLHSSIFAGQQKPTGFALSGCLIKDVSSPLILGRIKDGFDRKVLILRNPLSVALSKEGYGEWHAEGDIEVVCAVNQELRDVVQQCRDEGLVSSQFLEYVLVWCLFYRIALPHARECGMHVVFYEDLLKSPEETLYALFEYLESGRCFQRNVSQIMDVFKRKSRTTSNSSRIMESARNATPWNDLKPPSEINQAYALLRRFGLFHVYKEEAGPQVKVSELIS